MPRFPWQLKRKVGSAESLGQQETPARPGLGGKEDLVSVDSSSRHGREAVRQRRDEKRRERGEEGLGTRSHQILTTPALLIFTKAGG